MSRALTCRISRLGTWEEEAHSRAAMEAAGVSEVESTVSSLCYTILVQLQ